MLTFRKVTLTIALILVCISGITAQTFDFFVFYEGTYKSLQAKAASQKRPYFVYFYSDWCESCASLEENTINDAKFIRYAQEKWLGYRADGESTVSEGAKLAKKYGVLFYPTILLFTPEGKLVEKITVIPSATALIAKLQANQNKHGEDVEEEETTNDEFDFLPEEQSGEGLFKVRLNSIPSAGYGVQVAALGNAKAVFKKIAELEKKYHHRNILLNINELNGDVIYKIILGPFISEEQANIYKTSLETKRKEKYSVLNLGTLK